MEHIPELGAADPLPASCFCQSLSQQQEGKMRRRPSSDRTLDTHGKLQQQSKLGCSLPLKRTPHRPDPTSYAPRRIFPTFLRILEVSFPFEFCFLGSLPLSVAFLPTCMTDPTSFPKSPTDRNVSGKCGVAERVHTPQNRDYFN